MTVAEIVAIGIEQDIAKLKAHCTCQPRIDPNAQPCQSCIEIGHLRQDMFELLVNDPVKEKQEREAREILDTKIMNGDIEEPKPYKKGLNHVTSSFSRKAIY